ncbi:Uu.00g049860.m01.CDS01 [Anthostomella pinea]|uniref:Uu.00g049860.m01.CDS01 n=1 Tax=Anthostomella pinea TaxID=933095 RepID=A0AAI8V6Y7_9PEZI|nr:Uu.00g049860.m01.CDS01 [Anthostomella pinea]
MKASTMIVSALAAVASAAPATSTSTPKRSSVDLNAFNQFNFNSLDLQYFNAINAFDLQSFAQLSAFNNLDIGGFQALFSNDVFDINALLQLQQIALLSQLGGLGVFANFDLSAVQFAVVDLGLVSAIGGFDVSSLIDQSLVSQIQTVVQTTRITTVAV